MKSKIEKESSNVKSWEYSEKLRLLTVGFKNGSYIYTQVPPEIHLGAMFCESIGKYFNENVKGVFEFRKVMG